MTSSRAVVLGASGHIGNAVVRELLARGYQVTAARRGQTAARNLAGLAVRDVLGDADRPEVIDGWVSGHDLVVDAAAPYPMALTDRGAVATAARRAAVLVDAAARHRARLLHVGSLVTGLGTDAAGWPHEPGQRLDSVLHPYFAAKRAGEAVLATAARAGAPITIVQPTLCLGPWDSRPSQASLIPCVLAGRLPVVPAHIINVVDVRDVARAAIAAAECDRSEPLRITGHNIGVPELFRWIGELAGVAVATRGIPTELARAGAWALELSTAGVWLPPTLLLTLLVLRHHPLGVSADQRALDAVPRPLSATLRDAIAWYRDN